MQKHAFHTPHVMRTIKIGLKKKELEVTLQVLENLGRQPLYGSGEGLTYEPRSYTCHILSTR